MKARTINHSSKWALAMLISSAIFSQLGCSRDDRDLRTRLATPKVLGKTNGKESAEQMVGEPGQIRISGPGAVFTEKEIVKLSPLIQGRRSLGNACVDGDIFNPETSTFKKVPELNKALGPGEQAALKDIANNEYYINIGCRNLSATSIQGLKPSELKLNNKKQLIGTARRIFVCDTSSLKSQTLSLIAHEIALMSLIYTQDKAKGEINVLTNILLLQGKNKISTKAEKDLGTSIYLSVAQKISSVETTLENGTIQKGTLEISTRGGDCAKVAEPEEKEVIPKQNEKADGNDKSEEGN